MEKYMSLLSDIKRNGDMDPQVKGPILLRKSNTMLPPIRPESASTSRSKVINSQQDELLCLKSALKLQQQRLGEHCQTVAIKEEYLNNSNDEHFADGQVKEKIARRLIPNKPSPIINRVRHNLKSTPSTLPSPKQQQHDEDEVKKQQEQEEQEAVADDDVDSEIRKLEDGVQRCHLRISQIQGDMMRSWKAHRPKRISFISPPSPSVLLAKNDNEVIELATLVYDFADANKKRSTQVMTEGGFSPIRFENGFTSDKTQEANRPIASASAEDCSLTNVALTSSLVRSTSAFHVTDGATVFMETLANHRDVVLALPSKIGLGRKGDVLSESHILLLDQQDALRSCKGSTGIIAGAPYFRIVPKLNVAGVAQPTMSAVRTIANELRRVFDGSVIWINLRGEPLIYINNEAYIVRERKEPLNAMFIPNVTSRSITQIEDKLKQEVLKEARENGGNLSLHIEGKDGVMTDQWGSADSDSVFTLQEVFKGLMPAVTYYRRPITRNLGAQPHDFDFIFSTCHEDPQAVILFNCQTGRGKTSSMMLIANIVRFYQLCGQDASLDVRLLRTESRSFNFRTIKKIVSLIPDGKLHERRIMVLLEGLDKTYSIADHINAAFTSGSTFAEEDIMRLQQYAYFLVFSYYCEQRLWNFKIKEPFSMWLSENNELKLLIARIQLMEEEFKEERIVAPIAEGEEAWAASIVRHRRGNVLSAGRILCNTVIDSDERSGIRALRQLAPDVPIFTCGRLSENNRRLLIGEIRQYFPERKRVHWLSLRSEPMVFINNVSFSLSDYDTISGNITDASSTMHVSLQAIEQIEERLRRDVILEAQEHKGVILLHRIDENNKRSTIRVRVRSVRTPKQIMMDFATEENVYYHRVPIPFAAHLLPTDVDPLLEYFGKCNGEPDVFVINDTEGPTRTAVALNMLTLYRTSRVRNLRLIKNAEDVTEVLRVSHAGVVLPSAQIPSNIPVDSGEVPKGPVELRVAFTICQMLTAGSLLRVVKAVIALGGRGKRWNILHLLNYVKDEMTNATNKTRVMREAARIVRTYLLVLLSAIYIDSMGDYSTTVPFSDWVEKRIEVANILENIDQRAEDVLKYMDFSNFQKTDLMHRNGDVLTANFALKADHFPGCQKKGLRPELCGAPNFRKVDSINVYGVAIPTLIGIRNILSLLGASQEPLVTYPGEQNDKDVYTGFAAPRLFDPLFRPEELPKPLRGHVVWVNLREEPILYVGDRPFVLRNLDTPYVNVELTGIAAYKVEELETQLMIDVLKESENNNGMILVHDEGEPGELVAIWEPATRETVKTVREVYDELAGSGFRVTLLRLPVTDEQSPSAEDFDGLVTVLLPRVAMHMDRRETLSFVFNCQMGRGRTTTGMVICCLLVGLVMPEYYDGLSNMYNPLYKEEDSQLSRGEYTCIIQLKRVLTGGRSAKHHVDLVIEACSKMQNLRTAIESFALQAKSPDCTESQRGRAHFHGTHYLRRYFNLITFAAYLEEEYAPMKKQMQRTYASWLAQRPELVTLCESATLK